MLKRFFATLLLWTAIISVGCDDQSSSGSGTPTITGTQTIPKEVGGAPEDALPPHLKKKG
ncbi:MAG: hypothetical protein R3B84_19275 [Zavarzinella sp.]